MAQHLERFLAQVGVVDHEAGILQDPGQTLRGDDITLDEKNPHDCYSWFC